MPKEVAPAAGRRAARLVGKVHKILDRTNQVVGRLRLALADPRSAAVTHQALAALPELFTVPEAIGVRMTVRATEGLMVAEEVATSLTAVAGDVVTLIKAP